MIGRLLAALAVGSPGATGDATAKAPAGSLRAVQVDVQPHREPAAAAASRRRDIVAEATAQHRREAQYRRTKSAAEVALHMSGGRYL
jgi:hypothetical protein